MNRTAVHFLLKRLGLADKWIELGHLWLATLNSSKWRRIPCSYAKMSRRYQPHVIFSFLGTPSCAMIAFIFVESYC